MLKTGTRLAGRYEVNRTIGGGGMAVVYQAKDLVLDRWVAIKVMNQSLKNNNEFIQRFIREAKAAGSLSHPNVVSIFDIGREGATYYMVMEYVEGMTLADYVNQQGSLMSDEAMEIIIQICDGLTHAHKNGIVHRDIKSQNIMRTTDGRHKVTDFGISYFSNMSTSLTQTGTVMGSAHYLSPEQASGQKVTYTSDIYSVGILLFYLVTGRFPFDGESSVAIALKHLQEQLPDPRKLNPLISDQLCQVIQKALEKDPAQRFQTAEEMKQAIEFVRSGEGETAVGTSEEPAYHFAQGTQVKETETSALPPRHKKYKKKEEKRKHKGLWIALIAGSLLLLSSVLLSYFVWGEKEQSTPPPTPKPETVVKQPVQDQPESRPTVPVNTDLEGDHPWWKELPKEAYLENDFFKEIQVEGKDGEYDVSLQVGAIPQGTFYYNIYVVDRFSSRLILNGRSVNFQAKEDADYTPKTFHVSIPKPLLPSTGLLKIEIYRSTEDKAKADPIDNLLQQWGEVPEEEDH